MATGTSETSGRDEGGEVTQPDLGKLEEALRDRGRGPLGRDHPPPRSRGILHAVFCPLVFSPDRSRRPPRFSAESHHPVPQAVAGARVARRGHRRCRPSGPGGGRCLQPYRPRAGVGGQGAGEPPEDSEPIAEAQKAGGTGVADGGAGRGGHEARPKRRAGGRATRSHDQGANLRLDPGTAHRRARDGGAALLSPGRRGSLSREADQGVATAGGQEEGGHHRS